VIETCLVDSVVNNYGFNPVTDVLSPDNLTLKRNFKIRAFGRWIHYFRVDGKVYSCKTNPGGYFII